MKKILLVLLLVVAALPVANAQEECKVPISVQFDYVMRNTNRNRYDRCWVNFKHILERHGFTTEVHNTRVAISLVAVENGEPCGLFDKMLNFDIYFNDAYTGTCFYSTRLDNTYCGDYRSVRSRLADDLAEPMPELDSLVDSICVCVINAYEVNTKHMAEVAHEYAQKGDHETALFGLSQYPSCCPSYPKIRDLMVAIFRDYMRKNHDALLDVAKDVWKYQESDSDARFVVSLLNNVKLTEKEQKKADKLFRKIAKEYPAVNLKSDKDFSFDPMLKEIALREAYAIGVEYGASDDIFPDAPRFNSDGTRRWRKFDYYHSYDSYGPYDYFTIPEFESMMDLYHY